MNILGLSAFYHDSAAVLLCDGNIAAAAQEERFSRRKHDSSFPRQAIEFCLDHARVMADDIDHVVFYDKPFLKFERLLETSLSSAPRGFLAFRNSMPTWLKEKLFQKSLVIRCLNELFPSAGWAGRLLFSEHHLSHAASAYYPSPFPKAAVLTMDGVGEWATTSIGAADGSKLRILSEIHFPHSLGLLYSAFTYYLGFKVNSGEGKVMGLAPYGSPRYSSLIRDHLIDIKDDGSYRLDMAYFDYCTGVRMTNARFDELFAGPPRTPESPIEQRHMDIAASIQAVIEEGVVNLARAAVRQTGERRLCLAGGVALNCVANGKLLRSGVVDELWIQPAAGDAGGALGAALAAYHLFACRDRVAHGGRDGMSGSLLGPGYQDKDVELRLARLGASFEVHDPESLIEVCSKALADGLVVGWHQGRMEYGPRALGARSILADPRSPQMHSRLNSKIKFREAFRPFAPAVLAEDAGEWFSLREASPYMQLAVDVHEQQRRPLTNEERQLVGLGMLEAQRTTIPAVTHVDYSARVQTVHADTNARFHALLSAFKRRTGCPVLVNTSFNVRGEPIVCSPEDAFRCFMATGLDLLAVGNCVMRKSKH